MKLPIPFGKKQRSEYYLALLLRDEKVSAVILEETLGKVKVTGKHDEYFTKTIEDASVDEWLDVFNKAISSAEQTLPANIETQKTVFGVKESWVDDKKIKKDYLLKLKKVSQELGLSPIGFLVITEAIAHLIQEEEGAPLTGILTEIGRNLLTISLLRAGKIVETKSSPIIESEAKTVDTLLKYFSDVEILPSRILVFNGEDNEKIGQTFITHQWSKSLPFLHVPQVSVLPPEFDARAVVFGAAAQMGFEVLDANIGKDIIETQNPLAEEITEKVENTTSFSDTIKIDEAQHGMPDKEATNSFSSNKFGFVVNQDIADSVTNDTAIIKHAAEEKENTLQADQNIEEATIPVINENEYHAEQTQEIHKADPHIQTQNEKQKSNDIPKRSFLTSFLTPITSILSRFSLSKVPVPSFSGVMNKKVFLLLPLLLLFVGGIAAFYVFIVKATVTIHVKPKSVHESKQITFALDGANDLAKNIIAVKPTSVTLDGTATTNVTGKKEVGDKAKGTVTLYNSDTNQKQIEQGTVITSSNNLDFTIDKTVTVASASGDIFSGIKSGTAQVSVTAKSIGIESNLPSNTKFTLVNSSNVAAKNDSAFAGGSKKEVSVVAKADVDKLLKDVSSDLTGKAQDELKKKLSSDQTLLPITINIHVDKKNYDKNIGDEAKTLTLNGTITFQGAAYQNNDLTNLAQTLMKHNQTNDLLFSDKGISTSVNNIKQDDSNSKVTADLSADANLVPQIDKEKVIKEVTGKSFTDAKDKLTSSPQVDNVEIKHNLPIPFLPELLPFLSKNISVFIQGND